MKNMVILIVSLLISSLALALSYPRYTVSYQVFEGDKLLVAPTIKLSKGEAVFISNIGGKVVEVGTELYETQDDKKSCCLSSSLTIDGVKIASVEKNIVVNSSYTFEGDQYKIIAELNQTK